MVVNKQQKLLTPRIKAQWLKEISIACSRLYTFQKEYWLKSTSAFAPLLVRETWILKWFQSSNSRIISMWRIENAQFSYMRFTPKAKIISSRSQFCKTVNQNDLLFQFLCHQIKIPLFLEWSEEVNNPFSCLHIMVFNFKRNCVNLKLFFYFSRFCA